MKYPAGLSTVFDFGKHKGKTIEEVCDEDLRYMDWCLSDVDGFTLDAGAKRYLKDCITGAFEKAKR